MHRADPTGAGARRPPHPGWVGCGVVGAALAAVGLLTPWVALGRRQFASLDLIAAASALEVVSGGRERLVLAAWMVVPVLAAAAFVLAALGRRRSFGLVLVPLGPIYAVVLIALARAQAIRTLWGLWFAMLTGVASTIAGVAVLWPRQVSGRAPTRCR